MMLSYCYVAFLFSGGKRQTADQEKMQPQKKYRYTMQIQLTLVSLKR